MKFHTLIGLAISALSTTTLVSLAAQRPGGPYIENHAKVVKADRKLLVDGAHFVRGNAKSEYVLVGFVDYQCPACRQWDTQASTPIVDSLKSVAYAVRNFPLPMHRMAIPSAKLSAAAIEAGDFGRVHRALMAADTTQFTEKGLTALARKNHLDYRNALGSHKADAIVKADMAVVQKLGLNTTPTYFLVGPKGQVWEMRRPEQATEVLVSQKKTPQVPALQRK